MACGKGPVSYGAGLLTVRREERRWRRWKTETKSHQCLTLPGTRDGWTPEEQNDTVGGSATKRCQAIWGLHSGGKGCGDSKDMLPLAAFLPSRRRLIMSLGRFYSSGFEPKSCMWFSNSHFITHHDYFHYVWLALSLFRFSRDIKGLNQSNIRCVWDSVSCMRSVNKHWWKNILVPNSATPNPTNMHIKAP